MKAYQILFPLFFAVLTAGCIDDPVSLGMKSVTGRIVSQEGFPPPIMFINTNGTSTGLTNDNGDFSINDVNLPYSLFVTEYGSNLNMYAFLDITKPHTVLTLQWCWEQVVGSCYLTIHFPVLDSNRAMIPLFSSNDFYAVLFTHTAYPGDSINYIDIKIPPNKTFISGKIIYLEFWPHGSRPWYKKYGIKDVTLNTSENEISFSEEEIKPIPEEIEIEPTIICPPGMTQGGTAYYFSFNKNKSSEILFYAGSDFKVPLLPDLDYKIKILSRAIGNGGIAEKWVRIKPGENSIIVHNQVPKIISPANGDSNVTNMTDFAIEDNSGPGIYELYLSRVSGILSFKDVYIYTNEKHLRMGELIYSDYVLQDTTYYYLNVRKFSGFNSINEYVTQPFALDTICSSIETTDLILFKTGNGINLLKNNRTSNRLN